MTGKTLNDKPMCTREIKNQIPLGSDGMVQSMKTNYQPCLRSWSSVKGKHKGKVFSGRGFITKSGPGRTTRNLLCDVELHSAPLCSLSSDEQQSGVMLCHSVPMFIFC